MRSSSRKTKTDGLLENKCHHYSSALMEMTSPTCLSCMTPPQPESTAWTTSTDWYSPHSASSCTSIPTWDGD